MNCSNGICRINKPQGVSNSYARPSTIGGKIGSEYILFTMDGCTHCESCKKQIKYCRDRCFVIREVNVAPRNGYMSPRDWDLFQQYGKGEVPLLLKLQNGSVQDSASGVSNIMKMLQK